MHPLSEKAKKIQCVICDVDGVLTDGLLYMDNHNNERKAFHVHDGVGLKLLMAADIQVAVITGSVNSVIDVRMKQLGIVHYFKGDVTKSSAYATLKSQLNLQDDAFAYIGDDIIDLPIMRKVGLSIAVANASQHVKNEADWCTQGFGGQGAVREVSELILNLQNKLDAAIESYLPCHG